MKMAILIFVALVIVSLSVWADEPSFVDDGYYHYYRIVGFRLDVTGEPAKEEALTLLKLLAINARVSEVTRWRLITGQDQITWPSILILGFSVEPISSTENSTSLVINLKPTLEINSSLKINGKEIRTVLEKKTENGWEVIRTYNFKIMEVKEKEPRFLP